MQNDKHTMKDWVGKEVFTKIRDKVVHRLPPIANNLNELIDSFKSITENQIRAPLDQLLLNTPRCPASTLPTENGFH